MPKTEAWWVCTNCGTKIYRVGKGKENKWEIHRLICPKDNPGMRIKQIPQRKLDK